MAFKQMEQKLQRGLNCARPTLEGEQLAHAMQVNITSKEKHLGGRAGGRLGWDWSELQKTLPAGGSVCTLPTAASCTDQTGQIVQVINQLSAPDRRKMY